MNEYPQLKKYDKNSVQREFCTAKIPYGENSVRQKLRTTKNPYGEFFERQNFIRRKIQTAKNPTADIPTAKIPARIMTQLFLTTTPYHPCTPSKLS